ncbi:5-oxoprolinase subunit B family protein [Pedococcus sp. 5OH_020]|uniref:5-oxoprolinase subunit B family protein n=1 Tax=Pedococcus sp. 5OH_020 TaxID=2989814 RepID=UPI0022E9B998|nr:allophanate hydrolase subunit 1 [Pedococcus sp. 5OH_020]
MHARLLPYGDGAVLVELDSLDDALALHGVLTGPRRPAGLSDAVLGARTVLLVAREPRFLPGLRTAAQAAVAQPPQSPHGDPDTAEPPPDPVRIPVRYDGPDLAQVCDLTGLSQDEVVAAHTATPWTVGFAGFAPGFAYLVGGDPRLRVPRRTTPRSTVPAGSVGLADEFSGIYPRDSPGGWQLVGTTDAQLWSLDRNPPALLRPRGVVWFTDVAAAPAGGQAAPEGGR